MPAAIKVKITGLKEAQKALRQLPDKVARRIVFKIMRRRLKPIAETMRENAPEDDGDLKKSIRVGTRLSKRQRRAHRKVNRHDMEMFAGPGPFPQAIQQEFGNVNHDAQPFVRPAWHKHKNRLPKDLATDFWREIRRVKAKGVK